MMRLRLVSVAEQDVAEAADWFESQRPGLGNDFLDDLEKTRREIAKQPLACPSLVLGTIPLKVPLRSIRVGRFSHIVVFAVNNDEITIYAVVHPHRDLGSLLAERIGIHSD
jgi:plasmid stabilization system protein ParE